MKSGIVVLSGKPNTGKSTLLNTILGTKLAPMSPKPQTTRKRLKGIYTEERGQIVFIDSPGIHNPIHELGRYMLNEALKNLNDGDIILWIVDGSKELDEEDTLVYDRIKNYSKPKFLIVNKLDLFRNKVEKTLEKFLPFDKMDKIIPISSLTGENVNILLDEIFNLLPEGEYLYDPEILTDSMEIDIVKEIIQEKLMFNLEEEVPHSSTVVVEEFKERENGKVYIRATIYVEKESQRKIVIGFKGNLIKKIGTEARLDIEKFLGKPVYLELWVKIYKNWRKSEEALKFLGYK
ncbi:MAG: GTPase Era [Caldisericia bacterium]|jgi:GTP-binding protein Era|nr:GTPase Era [Caldisericia bacterium]